MEPNKLVQISLMLLIVAVVVKIIFGALISILLLSPALIPVGLIGGYIFFILIVLSFIFGIIGLKKRKQLDIKHKRIAVICIIINSILLALFLISLIAEIV